MFTIKISADTYLVIKPIKSAANPHSTGQGTDIHVMKVAPGSEFGQGYIVEIFDYGQKVDERFVQTKKQVMELVKEQKSRYNTNKAFEEELKLHVTYKSPGGQGFQHQGSSQGEIKMDIDQILYEKAAKINNLVASLEDPKIPRKEKIALDPAMQSMQPKSPSIQLDNSGEEITSNEQLIEFIKNELVEYFSDPTNVTPDSNMTQQSNVQASVNTEKKAYAPGENPENVISKYFSKIKDIINAEDPNHTTFNLDEVVESLKHIFKDSGLPGWNVLFKTAGIEEDKLVSKINTDKESLSIKNTLENTENADDLIENIAKKENKNEAETLLSKLSSEQYLNDLEEMFRYAADDFWKYLKNYKGINTLNKVYSEWQKKVNPLVINQDMNPILKSYVLNSIEGYIKTSRKEEIHKYAFNSVIDNYRKATTIIINEGESEEPSIIKKQEDTSQVPISENNISELPKQPNIANTQDNTVEQSSSVPTQENRTLLDILKE